MYGEMPIKRGRKRTYLGMDIDLSNEGVAKIFMRGYIDEAVEELTEDVSITVSSPASDHIFKTRKGELLSDEQAILFHCLVAKMLFVSKHARPNIQPTTSFLTTRVQNPNKDDWKKLCQLLQYLNVTRDMCLTINSDDLNVVHWWVDAAYDVHDDIKGHTGATMSTRKAASLEYPENRISIPLVQLKARSLVCTIILHKSCGRNISSETKGSMSIPPLSTKKTKAPSYWKKMAVLQAQISQSTSIPAIYLFRIALIMTK